ncbi:hypothetical protein D3C72_2380340 [compost metagenome]
MFFLGCHRWCVPALLLAWIGEAPSVRATRTAQMPGKPAACAACDTIPHRRPGMGTGKRAQLLR